MLRNKLRVLLQGYLFLGVTLVGSALMLFTVEEVRKPSLLVLFTFVLNGAIIAYQLVKDSKLGYSLNDIFNVFMFIFMFMAPLLQYLSDRFPWWNRQLLTDDVILATNAVVLIFICVYYISNFLIKKRLERRELSLRTIRRFENVESLLNVGFVCSLVIGTYIIMNAGFLNLFTRKTNILNLDTTLVLIVSKSLRSFPLVLTIMHLYYRRIHKRFYSKYQFSILLLLVILLHFPTGLPRFQVAVAYLALGLAIKQEFRNKYMLRFAILLGLLVAFPVIGFFRNNTFGNLITLSSIVVPTPWEDLVTADFDSYSMLSRVLLYVKDNSATYGRQLFGAVLFFVPRAIWPSKPIGSGALVARSLGWPFTNVSCPFIGEGYINFGILGVVIFAIILANIVTKLDLSYQWQYTRCNSLTLASVVYPLLFGFMFFMLRGDLMSSLAYTLGYVFPISVLYLLGKAIGSVKPKRGFAKRSEGKYSDLRYNVND